MLQNAKRVHLIIGGVVGLNLLVGAAAAAGVVPRPSSSESAAVSIPVVQATPDTALEAATVPEETTTTAPPETTVPPTAPPTTARPRTTTTAAPVQEQAAAATPAPTAAPAPATPSRLNPSSAQVMSAVAQITKRFPLYQPTEAQARQFGNAVCDALDQGQSYSAVTSAVRSEVAKLPFIQVSPADLDFAVRTAIQLFCPQYLSQAF